MHKPESIFENNSHKILWAFEIDLARMLKKMRNM